MNYLLLYPFSNIFNSLIDKRIQSKSNIIIYLFFILPFFLSFQIKGQDKPTIDSYKFITQNKKSSYNQFDTLLITNLLTQKNRTGLSFENLTTQYEVRGKYVIDKNLFFNNKIELRRPGELLTANIGQPFTKIAFNNSAFSKFWYTPDSLQTISIKKSVADGITIYNNDCDCLTPYNLNLENSIIKSLSLSNTVFNNPPTLINLEIDTLSIETSKLLCQVKFFNCKLPKSIYLASIFSTTDEQLLKLDLTGFYNENKKDCELEINNCDISKIMLDYSNFKLAFTHSIVTNQEKENITNNYLMNRK